MYVLCVLNDILQITASPKDWLVEKALGIKLAHAPKLHDVY